MQVAGFTFRRNAQQIVNIHRKRSWEADGLLSSAYDDPNRHLPQDDLSNGYFPPIGQHPEFRWAAIISVCAGKTLKLGGDRQRMEPGPIYGRMRLDLGSIELVFRSVQQFRDFRRILLRNLAPDCRSDLSE